MIVVDTSVWIDYVNGKNTTQVELLDRALSSELIVVGDLILAELLQGFRKEADAEAVKRQLMKCQYFDMVGYETAIESAHNYRELRSKGITVRKTMDMMIGAFCIRNGYWLLHNDRDFDPMEEHLGLKVLRY